jgi:hypothetical protein
MGKKLIKQIILAVVDIINERDETIESFQQSLDEYKSEYLRSLDSNVIIRNLKLDSMRLADLLEHPEGNEDLIKIDLDWHKKLMEQLEVEDK